MMSIAEFLDITINSKLNYDIILINGRIEHRIPQEDGRVIPRPQRYRPLRQRGHPHLPERTPKIERKIHPSHFHAHQRRQTGPEQPGKGTHPST